MPGDWPAQFYIRQNVYSKCYLGETHTSTTSNDNQQPDFHEYLQENSFQSIGNSRRRITQPLQAAVPLLGPLHVSLNAREDLMINFHSFFKHIYESIFAGSKLADKPKPWRTSLILELTYGGWTLIRERVRDTFSQCKHLCM